MNMNCNNFVKLDLMFGFLFCFGICMIGNVSAGSYNADDIYSFYYDCFSDMLCERKVPLRVKECVVKVHNKTKDTFYELFKEATPPEKQHLCFMDVFWSDENAVEFSNEMFCKLNEEQMAKLSEVFDEPIMEYASRVCSTLDGVQECQDLQEYNACIHSLIEESMEEGYCKSVDKSEFAFTK
ncbi:uncharacterized protein LOC129226591 [Uloborus diversus]|uniref:uncharacterized protein LOC129226591 n=1 Tax=Uloborus diversus TaxID=327109 RepID=UPI0024092805|nr:uncharacterized protein LOC129226591 [Uloborus diversus]